MEKSTLQIEIFGELPQALDERIALLLSDQAPTVLCEEKIRSLRIRIANSSAPMYQEDWAAFTYLYFSANFLKTYLAILSAASNVSKRKLRILDLGCGGGSSTAASVSAFQYLGNELIEIVAIDHSSEQLQVFDQATTKWIEESTGNLSPSLVLDDALKYLDESKNVFDFIILSYITNEMSAKKEAQLRDKLLFLKNNVGTTSIVIDSDKLHRGISVELIGEAPYLLPYSKVSFRASSIEGLGFNTPPKFSNSQIEHHVISNYFLAWRTHNLDLVKNIFDPNCEYTINDSKTLHGIDEILEYWSHNAERQRNIVCSFSFLNCSTSNATFRWWASFDRIDTQDRRHLNGQMFTTFRGNTITSLSEAYTQTISTNH